jgi:hypothetical protein
MNWLKANSNLVWCGYYLAPAPSHGDRSWMGKRASLKAAGWGIAPVFVGQQTIGPGSHNPSAATGTADGQHTASLMKAEGFAPGSCVYLDLENGPPLTDLQHAYVAAWCDAVQAGGYQPGVYCSHLLALEVHSLRPNCRIWAFKVATNTPHPVPIPCPDPNPSGSGYLGSYAWQLGQNCILAVPPAHASALSADLSSAIVPDPGAPAIATAAGAGSS